MTTTTFDLTTLPRPAHEYGYVFVTARDGTCGYVNGRAAVVGVIRPGYMDSGKAYEIVEYPHYSDADAAKRKISAHIQASCKLLGLGYDPQFF